MGLSVFLTGSTGFVGNAILRRLVADGHRVSVGGRNRPDNFEGAFFQFDLEKPETLALGLANLSRIDVVVHTAGSLHAACDSVNREGTVQLLRCLADKTKKWIQLGSAGVYLNNFRGLIDETTPCHPATPYETSKLEADLAVLAACPDAVILRPTMVAGEGMKGSPLKVFSRVLAWGIASEMSPNHTLNMVHVDDVADAVVFFCGDARKNEKGIFILSDDLDMPTILELTGAPPNSHGKRIRYTVPPRLLYLAALAGSAVGISFFNLRRHAQLTNETRFSSARIRQIYPEWPRAGSHDAARNFAAGKRK